MKIVARATLCIKHNNVKFGKKIEYFRKYILNVEFAFDSISAESGSS